MNVNQYLEKVRKIQNNLLSYIEIEDRDEENYENLIKSFDDNQIKKNRYDLKLIINLIVSISNYHNRGTNFFEKIEKILTFFKDEITNFYSNTEIFNLFKSNKRILLFLIKEKFLIIDIQIANEMINHNFGNYKYFEPELWPFIKEIEKKERKFGQGGHFIPPHQMMPIIPMGNYLNPMPQMIPSFPMNNQLNQMNPQFNQMQMMPIFPMYPQLNQMNPQFNQMQMMPIIPMYPQSNQMNPQLNQMNLLLNQMNLQLNQMNPQLNQMNSQLNQMNPQLNQMNPHSNQTNTELNQKNDQVQTNKEKVEDGPILPDDFEEKRRIGENDDHICEIIRKDQIEEFIIYVNKNNMPLRGPISPSIYETNSLLIKSGFTKDSIWSYERFFAPQLIEYASFFGSIQIFKYLYKNGVELTSSLWIYAIHGQDPEIIRILEDSGIKPQNESYIECYKEAIKCHHNETANYIEINYIQKDKLESSELVSHNLEYYNFNYIPDNLEKSEILELCKYDYYTLIDLLLKTKNIDINHRIIFYFIFKCNFK